MSIRKVGSDGSTLPWTKPQFSRFYRENEMRLTMISLTCHMKLFWASYCF